MPSANDLLRDRAILHQINIGRLTLRETEEILRFLRSVDRDLVRRIRERGVDGSWTTKRLQKLLKSIRNGQIIAYRDLREQFKKNLADISLEETLFAQEAMTTSLKGAVDIAAPAATTVFQSALNRPFLGRRFTEWFGDLAANKVDALDRGIRQGVVEGETVQQVTRRVRDILGTQNRHAETIARTAINHTVTHSREMVYQANADVIKGIQWLSTLDSKTSDICIRRDGEIYPIMKGPRPPAHPRCRSTTVPVTKSFKELGLPFKEFPPSTRASINGQVSRDLSYGPWLKTQSNKMQEAVLGSKRAKLFRDGNLDIKKFSDETGRRFTLKQLRKNEARAWKRAKLPDPDE